MGRGGDRRCSPRPGRATLDLMLGEGMRYRLGNPPTTELEIFPDADAVKVTTTELAIRLVRQSPPVLAPEAVNFVSTLDPENQWLSITPDGSTTLISHSHLRGHETALVPVVNDDQSISPPTGDQPLSVDSMPSQMAPEEAFTGSEDGDARERVRLAGRLGADSHFRTTRNGKTVAFFPLAIRQDDGSTQWRDVIVFNERAEKLRANEPPAKSQFVDIVGCLHEKEVTGKDGTVRKIAEIHAVVVKPR